MRANLAMLAVLAGVGLSISDQATADAKNLSCITNDSPTERRVLRDCEKQVPVVMSELPIEIMPPPPPPRPARILRDGGRKGGDAPDHHTEPKGGNSGGGNSGGGTGSGPAN